MILFDKEYTGESVIDMDREITEFILDDLYDAFDIPQDAEGVMQGRFHIRVEWVPE